MIKEFVLSKIWRQKAAKDGLILARIRTGTQTDQDLEWLNRNVTYNAAPGYTVLSPFVNSVQRINECQLELLNGPEFEFEAVKRGTFAKAQEKQLPLPTTLKLRRGCRVIIKKNDTRKLGKLTQQVFNGDQGVFYGLDKHNRLIIELDRGVEVVLPMVKIYTGTKTKKKTITLEDGTEEEVEEIVQNKANMMKQYPVRLGFAITISSSQGMTMDRVHLDLGAGLWDDAYGLLYVALSRIKFLDKLTLSRKLTHEDNKVSPLLEPMKEEQYEL